jgi:hypothetical protein
MDVPPRPFKKQMKQDVFREPFALGSHCIRLGGAQTLLRLVVQRNLDGFCSSKGEENFSAPEEPIVHRPAED